MAYISYRAALELTPKSLAVDDVSTAAISLPVTVPQFCDSRWGTWGGAQASRRGGSWGELGEPGSRAVLLSELPGEVQHSGWHAGSRHSGHTSPPGSQVTFHTKPEIPQQVQVMND